MATREYTHDERCKIIKYIVDNKRFTGLKGVAIWKEIEKAKIIPRTWQSMRTQFKGKIIDLLHLFDITEEDRWHILNGSRKTIDNYYAPFPATKLSKFSFSSDSDSDATICTAKKTKNNEICSKQETHVASSSSSPDLLFEVTNKAVGSQRKDSNEVPERAQQNDVIEIHDSDEANENNCDTVSFSLKEDNDLISFFKKDERLLNHIHNDCIYETFVLLHSFKKPWKSAKNRFIKHILPNLFTYECLTTDEMLKFYDTSGLEVPEELKCKIRATPTECLNTTKNATVSVASSTDENIAHACIQASEPPSDCDKFNMSTVGKCIAVMQNESVHAFIAETDSNNSAIIKRIQDEIIIPEGNIHITDTESFAMLNSANQVRRDFQSELKLFIDGYFEKKEFNLQNIPNMDQIKLLIKNTSKSCSAENTDIVCNLFQNLEENENMHEESSNDINMSYSIVASTAQSESSISENNNLQALLSTQDGLHEISTELSVQAPLQFHCSRTQLTEVDSAIEYRPASQLYRNVIYPEIRDGSSSDEFPRSSISHETRITSDDINSMELTESSHASYTKLDTENERSTSKSSNELQTQTTSDTFYSAYSQDFNMQN